MDQIPQSMHRQIVHHRSSIYLFHFLWRLLTSAVLPGCPFPVILLSTHSQTPVHVLTDVYNDPSSSTSASQKRAIGHCASRSMDVGLVWARSIPTCAWAYAQPSETHTVPFLVFITAASGRFILPGGARARRADAAHQATGTTAQRVLDIYSSVFVVGLLVIITSPR